MTADEMAAFERLLRVAQDHSGQSRKVADFLLACWNATDNGGWDPNDLWAVDDVLADDMLTMLAFIRREATYFYDYEADMRQLWEQWREPESEQT